MLELFGTVPGAVIKPAEVKNGSSLISVMKGVTSGEVEVKAQGLVVAIAGGASVPQGHPSCYEAQKLATRVVSRGGVLVNGGENGGTMLAVNAAEPDTTLGVACPYHELIPYGAKAIVNSYQTQKNILSILPVVVVFPGQVGTLDLLINSVGWIKSLQHQNATPPELWLHTYWWDVLELLNNKGAIQSAVWQHIHKFNEVDEILNQL